MKKLQLLLFMLLALPIGMLAAGTTWQSATEISRGGSSTGTLSGDQQVQWFKIVVPENGEVTIKVSPNSGLDLNYTTMYAKNNSNEMTSRGYCWSANEFTVTDCAAGTYYVEVRRNGGQGEFTISYAFKATSDRYANDSEPNDTWQNAKSLSNHTNATGHLGYLYVADTDKVDWYKIDVPENGSVKVTVIAHGNLGLNYTTLYAKDNNNEMTGRGYCWSGNEETNGVFTVNDCAKGTYYLEVKHNGGEGGYTLRYDFTPTSAFYANDSEPNDTWQDAKSLSNHTNATGHLGYLYVADTDKVDWYKINVPENGSVKVTVIAHGNLGLNYTTLYAKDNNNEMHSRGYCWSGNEETNGEFTVNDCAKGTYYLEVKHNGGEGGYTLKYDFTPTSSSYLNDIEPNDAWQNAQLLKRGNTVTGHLGYLYYDDTDKVDWFKIEVPRDGTIKLNITPHDNLGLNYTTIYAKDSQNEMHSRGYCWSGPADITVTDAAPGTYYIEVKHNGGEGAYSLQYVFEQNPYATDAEPNDEKNRALSLDKGVTVAGHLGYTYYDDRDDVDWYKVTLSSKSNVTFTYQAQESLGFNYVTLYNSENSSVAYAWGNGNENNVNQVIREDLDAGTYYLEVKRNGGQGYYLLAFASTLGTVQKLDPLPDETQEPQVVTVEGSDYEVDEPNKTVTITDSKPDDKGDIYICGYPGSSGWKVFVEPKIFWNFDGKTVKIDYIDPPQTNGDIPADKVKGVTLIVPAGSKEKYEKDPQWGKFGTIKEETPVNPTPGPGPNPSVESNTCLIVWLSETRKDYYLLSEKPKVTMNNGDFTLTTTNTTVYYNFADVLKFTLGEKEGTAIESLAAEAGPSVERQYDRVVFTGCKPESTIYIYNVGGQLLDTQRADGSGRAEVSIASLAAGVYVVKSDSVTIKIAKR